MKRIIPFFLLITLILNGCNIATGSNAAGSTPVIPSPAAATLLPVSTSQASTSSSTAYQYGQEVARPLIRDFANMGPRVAGSPVEAQAAQYIATIFTALGYNPEIQAFTAIAGDKSINSANVVAMKTGNSSQEIIVGAHYDSTDAGPGADDNASGLAVMLEVAKLVQNASNLYTIRFIAFGAAENGLLGSYAYLNQMSQEEFENVIGMIDLDSLVAGDIAYVYGDEDPQSSVRDWALEWAVGNGFDLQTVRNVDLTDPASGKGTSDYAPFRDAGIPYAYFQSSNWNLGDKKGSTQVDVRFGENGVIRHTKYDTLEYLDTNFPGRVDSRLNLFITIIFNLLTQFEAPKR
jgi:alkaline phosphatase isozyme conversion protein